MPSRCLRIGIDYRPALMEKPAGIGRTVRSFVKALAEIDHPHEILLYAEGPSAAPLPRASLRLGPPGGGLARRAAWHAWSALDVARGAADIYVTLSSLFVPFILPARCVVFVHDLSPLHAPWAHTLKVRTLTRIALGRSLRRAARIVVNSEFTREDVLRRYPARPAKVVTAHLGLDHAFECRPDEEAMRRARERYRLPPRYILAVNTLEPRKNISGLLRAYALLKVRRPEVPNLVIAGKPGWLADGLVEEARGLGLQEDVIFTGWVEDADLPVVYALADVFVLPSFLEGFGLPLLEAMASGIPIVTSGVTALPEIAGDAALYADPRSPDDIAAKIATVLDHPSEAERLRAAGLARVRHFTWTLFARRMMAVVEEAADEIRT